VAGTYTYTLTLTPWSGTAETTKVVTQDVSIVVTAPASASTTAASTFSSTVLVSGTTVDSATATQTSVSLASTASATAKATVFVKLRNAAGTDTQNVKDSLTVTIDKGNVGIATGAALGKNTIIDYNTSGTAGGVPVYVFADGSTGTATITVATKNAGSFTQTLTWYGTDAKSIVAGGRLTVIPVGTEATNDKAAVRAQAFDIGLQNLASSTALYAYSSDTSVISNFGTACGATAVSSSDNQWYTYCPLTGVKAGSATITIRDAATVAAAFGLPSRRARSDRS
jgi:hypothetical protein